MTRTNPAHHAVLARRTGIVPSGGSVPGTTAELGEERRRQAAIWYPLALIVIFEVTQLAVVLWGIAQSQAGRSTDILQLGEDLSTHPLILLQMGLPLPLMIWFTLGLPRRHHRLRAHEYCLIGLVHVAVFALLVGLMRGNPTAYVVGDFYQLLVVPVIYFSAGWRFDSLLAQRAARRIVSVYAAVAMIWLAIEIYHLQRFHSVLIFSTSAFVVPLFYTVAKFRFRLRDLAWATLMLLGVFLSFKRSLYLGVILLLLVYALFGRRTGHRQGEGG